MVTHAQCPTPFKINEDTLRVFFATRPLSEPLGKNVARIGFVDLDAKTLSKIRKISAKPVLDLGERGMFDEFGVMPGCVIRDGDRVLLYYTGWTRMRSVPYSTAIGVALSMDGGETFCRVGPGPVLGLSVNEPHLVNSPIVKIVNGAWHMWYVSATRWVRGPQGLEIELRHAHAVSDNGIDWRDRKTLITPPKLIDECQDQMTPIHIGDTWHAIFAVRSTIGFRTEKSQSYRLAHATSSDLMSWSRCDESMCLQRPELGWDSEMIGSTHLFEHQERHLMLYCGNRFGREGFGLAELFIY